MKGLSKLVAALTICATAFLVFSCENDITEIGSSLFPGASANVEFVDVISYNQNNDSIRSDEQMLQSGYLGVYEEPVFGRTKAKFYTQARLGQLNPDFGTNPSMDSVILSIPVYFKGEEGEYKTDTTFLYLGENETPSDTATVRITRTYKLDSIYGNNSNPITLQVREVSKYMQSSDSIHFSNPAIANCQNCNNINNIEVFPLLLGSEQVKDSIRTYQVKKLTDPNPAPTVAIKIKLDKEYFKQKFIDNQNSPDLSDQASFIRNFFRGIEISTLEDQGFLFGFFPASPGFNLLMHYSYDETNSEGETEREDSYIALNFLSYWSSPVGYNVQVNQYEHANRSAQFVDAFTNPNTVQGAPRLFLAGMDGARAVIKIDEQQLNAIRDHVVNDGWAIVGAEFTFHVDESYGLKKPAYLFGWNNYVENEKILNNNFSDVGRFYNFYPTSVQFNPRYDFKENDKTYTIRITDYIKSIVERGEVFEDSKIILSLGNFLLSPSSGYTEIYNIKKPFLNNRSFNPYRIVLHGNNSEQVDKRLRLKIYYTKR